MNTLMCVTRIATHYTHMQDHLLFSFPEKPKIDQRFLVLKAVFLRIQVFRDMTLYWASGT